MVSPSLDHLPFRFDGANLSLTVEQRFPLSRVLGHRKQAAEAELQRVNAEVGRVELDVELQAIESFFMLLELVVPAAYSVWRRIQLRSGRLPAALAAQSNDARS